MKRIFPTILSFITRKPRHIISLPCPKDSWTGTVFRLWENFVGVPVGIKAQAKIDGETGKHISLSFRDFCTHGEVVVRKFFRSFKLEVVPVPILVTAGNGMQFPFGLLPQYNLVIAFVSATAGVRPDTTLDLGSGTNRICIFAGCVDASDNLTAITWKTTENFSKDLTQSFPGVGRYNYIWHLYPSATGSGTATLTGPTDNSTMTYLLYTGVSQSGQPKNLASSTATGTSITLSLTAANGDWLVGGGGNDTETLGEGANTTQRSANGSQEQADSNGVASPTALVFTTTVSASLAAYGGVMSPVPVVTTTSSSSSSSSSSSTSSSSTSSSSTSTSSSTSSSTTSSTSSSSTSTSSSTSSSTTSSTTSSTSSTTSTTSSTSSSTSSSTTSSTTSSTSSTSSTTSSTSSSTSSSSSSSSSTTTAFPFIIPELEIMPITPILEIKPVTPILEIKPTTPILEVNRTYKAHD